MFINLQVILITITFVFQFVTPLTINTNEIRDIEDTTAYIETEAAPWILTNSLGGSTKTSTCGSERLLGGYGITGVGTTFTRTYTSLPTHTVIQYAITFTVIDYSSGSNLFKITFDGTQVGTWDSNNFAYASSFSGSSCGGSQTDYSDIIVKGQATHSSSSLTIVVTSLKASGATFSFGFRDVSLLFKTSGTASTPSCTFISTGTWSSSVVSCLCGSSSYDVPGIWGCGSCNAACESCKDNSNTDCTSCASGYSWNGANCFKCSSSCDQCSGTAANQCVRCPTNSFLYWNNTCTSVCASPLVQGSQGMFQSCSLPCGLSNFYYQNATCQSTCTSPFVQASQGDLKYCNFPCGTGQYYQGWDSTCGACGFPLVQKTKGVERYCELPCGTGYYYQNGTCSSGCDQNFVTSTQGGMKYCNFTCTGSNFLYWNGSCYSTCAAPLTQVIQGLARYCQFPCPSKNDFYYAQNGSCLSSCDTGFLRPTQGDLKYCNFPCSGSDFLYWNGSCYSLCLAPLLQDIRGLGRYCYLPCPAAQYYYSQNNTCLPTCDTGFLQPTQGDLKYCNFPCSSSDFLYWNSTCYSSCLAPLQQDIRGLGRYCWLPCPASQYYYQNGSCLSTCDSGFLQPTQGDLKYCNFKCSGSDFLYWNRSCYSSCLAPLQQDIRGLGRYCWLPCLASQFYYAQNNTCLPSCDTGFLQPTQGDLKYCNFPCSGSDFLYWNGSCYSGCLAPLLQDIRGLGRYCNLPCPANQFYYSQNNTCLSTCDSGFLQPTQGDLKYCNFPCSGSDFLYWNGSCYSSCLAPLQQDIHGLGRYCWLPCPANQFYYAQNNTCLSTCDTGFLQPTQGDLKYCNFPCAASEYLYFNNSCYSTCDPPLEPDIRGLGRYCWRPCLANEYRYQNGSCLLSCDAGFTASTSGGLKFCNFNCSGSDFLYWNGTCDGSCLAPHKQDIRGVGRFCWLPCPANQFYYAQNNSCYSTCDQDFVQPTQGDLVYCNFKCLANEFMYLNKSCIGSCDFPLTTVTEGAAKYCRSPCSSNSDFINDNGTCTTQCNSPYVQRFEGGMKFCSYPCPSPQFLYWDNTCNSFCPTNYQTTQDGVSLCQFHCPTNQFLYWNQTCQPACDFPLVQNIDSQSYQTCKKPCNTNEYVQNNGSCSSACPYQVETDQNGVIHCFYPCTPTEYYIGGSKGYKCSTTCYSPRLIISITQNETLCNPPCRSNRYFSLVDHSCVDFCEYPQTAGLNGTIRICQGNSLADDPLVKSSVNIAKILASATGLFRPCSMNSLFTIALAKMVKYVRYIDVNIPEEIREALDASNKSTFSFSSAFSFSMPSGLDRSLQDHSLPKPFQGRGVTSSYLKNQWQSFSTLSILLAIALIIIGIDFLLRKKDPHRNFNRAIRRLKTITKWNILACLIFNIYDDFTLYFILEMYTLHINNFASFFSFAICLIMTGFAGYMIFKLFKLWKDWKTSQIRIHSDDPDHLEDQITVFYKKWAKFQVLHSGFKTSSFFEKSFVLVSTTRIIILYAIVGFLYMCPLAQSIMFLLMSFGMFYLIIKYKPFKNRINLYFTLIFETLVLAVNLCLLILAADDIPHKRITLFKVNVSKAILLLNIMIWIVSAIYLIYCIVNCMLNCYEVSRDPEKFKKTVWLNLIACIYFNPGMGFDELSNQDLDCPPTPVKPSYIMNPEILKIQEIEIKDITSPPLTAKRLLNQSANDTLNLSQGKSFIFNSNAETPSSKPQQNQDASSFTDIISFESSSKQAKSRLHHPSNRMLLDSINSRIATKSLLNEESPININRRGNLKTRIRKLFVETGLDQSNISESLSTVNSPEFSQLQKGDIKLLKNFTGTQESDNEKEKVDLMEFDQNKSLDVTDLSLTSTPVSQTRALINTKSAKSLKPSRFIQPQNP